MKSIILKVDKVVYSTRIIGEKYEMIKDNGSIPKVYDKNYWDWWKKKVSYFDEECDILIIHSDDLEIDKNLNQNKNKEWNSQNLTIFLRELQRIEIPLEFISYDDENQILKLKIDGEIKEFGTNKKIKFAQEEQKNSENKVIKKEKKIIAPAPKGSLADYYREQTNNYSRGK